MRSIIYSLLAAAWVLVSHAAVHGRAVAGEDPAPDRSRQTKPNIILIMADDLGYECIGANGCRSYQTPVLDTLANEGIRFEHCYAQPLCTPSRIQIMTGQYNVRNYMGWANLHTSHVTFANLLKNAGYTTCMAGKWQLGEITELPRHAGFDEFYLHPQLNYYWGASLVFNGTLQPYPQEAYGPDAINERACEFIERNHDRPFFLYYPIFLPHDPWLPTPDSGVPDAWKLGSDHKKSDRAYFADNIRYLDKLIGRVVTTLEEQGVRDNTLILFTGDNGTGVGVRTMLNDAVVIGGKGSMTDAGTHVPLIANWPAVIRTPAVSTDLVDFSDFLPTICAAAGAAIPADLPIDGRSFLPQLQGKTGTPREWVYSWFSKSPTANEPREWARTQRYKLYRTGEFHDVSADPLEQKPLTDLSPDAEAVRTALQHVLDQFRDARPAAWVAKEEHARAQNPEKATRTRKAPAAP